ncbi:MAG: efflux RND transporter periplasmic adaptor subunit [Alphaproteobacteria bacterium]|nr:efflux RND transporter periplasmic adaptor subunit [Alphaproteobacteria bacterium]
MIRSPRHKGTALAVLLLLPLGLAACKPDIQDPRLSPPLVMSTMASEASQNTESFTGIVKARVQSDLGFRVSGKIIQRLVDVGQTVKAGQPLMRIDPDDLALAITTKQEAVAAAKARAVQAIADEERDRILSHMNAVSRQTYEQAKAAADSARAQVAAAEAQAQIARNQGDYSLLVADADGTIVDTLAEPGQVVRAGQTVIKLAHAGPREASVELPETVRPAPDSTAQAMLYGNSATETVHLRQLSDAASLDTRTFEARYVLDGDMANAPLGATVTITLAAPKSGEMMEVPLGAVTDEGKGPGVWVITGSSTVDFHPVEIASLTEETALLKSGVNAQDRIVALGAHLLHEGEKVRMSDEKVSQ